jgi:nucleoside-diphosphate kinase
MIERTLVLIKPDGVMRGLVGEVIKRFEQKGLKIIGLKMVAIDKNFAAKHYTEDIEKRRGKTVRDNLLDYITEGPLVAMVIEGIDSIEVVRTMVGGTEPRSATPGTIRGDFTHHSFKYADNKNMPVKNIIHASSNAEDAEKEIMLWFSIEDLYSYRRTDEIFHYGE